METFDVVIGYNFFDVLFEFRRCEIRSSDPFPLMVNIKVIILLENYRQSFTTNTMMTCDGNKKRKDLH